MCGGQAGSIIARLALLEGLGGKRRRCASLCAVALLLFMDAPLPFLLALPPFMEAPLPFMAAPPPFMAAAL